MERKTKCLRFHSRCITCRHEPVVVIVFAFILRPAHDRSMSSQFGVDVDAVDSSNSSSRKWWEEMKKCRRLKCTTCLSRLLGFDQTDDTQTPNNNTHTPTILIIVSVDGNICAPKPIKDRTFFGWLTIMHGRRLPAKERDTKG